MTVQLRSDSSCQSDFDLQERKKQEKNRRHLRATFHSNLEWGAAQAPQKRRDDVRTHVVCTIIDANVRYQGYCNLTIKAQTVVCGLVKKRFNRG